MSSPARSAAFAATCTLLLLAGCGSEETAEETPLEPTAAPAVPVRPVSHESPPDAAVDQVPSEPEPSFTPPYPQREGLFQPPEVHQPKTGTPTHAAQADIQLKGFVRAEGQWTLLSIDGKVRAAKAGQRIDGVEIIAVEPPQVTLGRGRRRWTLSLDDER